MSKLDTKKIKVENLESDGTAEFREGRNPGDMCRWEIESLGPGEDEGMYVQYDVSWDPKLVQRVISSLVDPAGFR